MNKLILILAFFFSGLLTSYAQGAAPVPPPPPPPGGTKIDLDDESVKPAEPAKSNSKPNEYDKLLLDFSDFDWDDGSTPKTAATVTIGTQTWMGANLDVTTFRNGDAIPEAKTDSDWEVAYYNKKPAWGYYNGDAANGTKYGKLYNVYAILDSRGLAPAGWHIPGKEECDKLITTLPDNPDTGTKLRSTAEGDYAFVLGGYHSQNDFISNGKLGVWWTSTKKTIYGAWGASINDGAYAFSLYFEHNRFYSSEYSSEALSVRCIKD